MGQHCQNCGSQNRAGVLICERCGIALYGAIATVAKSTPDDATKKHLIQKLVSFLSKRKTEPLVDEQPTQRVVLPSYAGLAEQRPEDRSLFPPGTSLLFSINNQEVVINAPEGEIWLGRFGGRVPPPRDVYIVNLSDYDGYRLGISRLHATIRLTAEQGLEIYDLASSNGTRLNGQKLVPYELYPLYDGDQIQLGQLAMRVYFLYP